MRATSAGSADQAEAPVGADDPLRRTLAVLREGPTTPAAVAARTGIDEVRVVGHLEAFVRRAWAEGPDRARVFRLTAVGALIGSLVDGA